MSTDYLSTLGIGTGLNTTEIVDSLMDVERESRLSSITKKKDKLEAQISAYGELSEAFQKFKSKAPLDFLFCAFLDSVYQTNLNQKNNFQNRFELLAFLHLL